MTSSRTTNTENPITGPRCDSPTAATYLGVTLRVLADLRSRRAIPYYKIGHRALSYDIQDLDAFLARRRVQAIGWKK